MHVEEWLILEELANLRTSNEYNVGSYRRRLRIFRKITTS